MSQPPVLSVTGLVSLLKETVEDNFVRVIVEGEISNLARPASGHLYFSLKDDRAQIRGVMFKPATRLMKFSPENGMRTICKGMVTIYQQRGELQVVVDAIEPVGTGSLQLAFEQLKEKLKSEGLFDEERKRPIPASPRKVGIVTSATGAAIHDMLQVLKRRGVGVEVYLWPTKVQGEQAAGEIAAAISGLNRHSDVDLLIVGRGGGSIEDLWAFNEEVVARAIADSAIPVVSAFVHEFAFTVADFVADLRAATPTAAAEMICRNRVELETHVDRLSMQLGERLEARLGLMRERFDGLRRRLVSPRHQIEMRGQLLAEFSTRLQGSMAHFLERRSTAVGSLALRLDTLSPLKTLERGYAIAMRGDGKVVYDSADLDLGDTLQLRFSRGGAMVKIEEKM